MKFWVSIITVFLFLISLIRPVLPVYDYFLNYNYIVNVLCVNKDKPEMHCDGKCYLKKELSQTNNISNNTKNTLNNYRFRPVPVYFEHFNEFKAHFFREKLSGIIFSKRNSFKSVDFKPQVPPPRPSNCARSFIDY